MCSQLPTWENTLSPVPCGTASFEWLSVQHSFLEALAERGTQALERHRKKWYREQAIYNPLSFLRCVSSVSLASLFAFSSHSASSFQFLIRSFCLALLPLITFLLPPPSFASPVSSSGYSDLSVASSSPRFSFFVLLFMMCCLFLCVF